MRPEPLVQDYIVLILPLKLLKPLPVRELSHIVFLFKAHHILILV